MCSGLAKPKDAVIRRWAKDLGCRDVVLCDDFYPRFPRSQAVKSRSAEECFRLFASARFVITSSYHGCLFAAIHGVPYLPVQVPNQPPKMLIAAVETMGRHAMRICSEGPAYVQRNYDRSARTWTIASDKLRRRATERACRSGESARGRKEGRMREAC